MTQNMNLGLFVRLMQNPAATRKDLLEYIGAGPVSVDDLLSGTGRAQRLLGGPAQASKESQRRVPGQDRPVP
jgi:hypothetical protein